MTSRLPQKTETTSPSSYQIRLEGHLGPEWGDWFDGLSISLEPNGDTLLTGQVVDQAALYGLLRKARDLGMPLISVNRVYVNPTATLNTREQGAE